MYADPLLTCYMVFVVVTREALSFGPPERVLCDTSSIASRGSLWIAWVHERPSQWARCYRWDSVSSVEPWGRESQDVIGTSSIVTLFYPS
jgi:hypothetical protein